MKPIFCSATACRLFDHRSESYSLICERRRPRSLHLQGLHHEAFPSRVEGRESVAALVTVTDVEDHQQSDSPNRVRVSSALGGRGPAAAEPGGWGRGSSEAQEGDAEDEAGDAQGLVICATTARETENPWSETWLSDLWKPSFPSADLVDAAAAMFPADDAWRGREGPVWRVIVSPGAVSIESKDYARAERTQERWVKAQAAMVDQLAIHLAKHGEFPEAPDPTREITGWSRKSRARMVRTLCELDYAPLFTDSTRLLAMITLTYPGSWEIVAPDGATAKGHVRAFQLRYKRAWGEPFIGIWKQEFQRRGAPHFHILTRPPHGKAAVSRRGAVGEGLAFREWLSIVWADVVDHPDQEQRRRHVLAGTGVDYAEGLRATDPRRVAVYFTKHGSFQAKEYQHCVPELWQAPGKGPGRFWGYWGLEKARAGAELTPMDAVRVARTLRRWARAQGTTRQVTRPRVEQATGRIRYRNTRTRVVRCKSGRGWVSVNDGPAFAATLARLLVAE